MEEVCRVCQGTGRLLSEACPLCDGDPVLGSDNPRPYHVFLLAGQSNMVGRGTSPELEPSMMAFVRSHADVKMAYDIDKSAKEQQNTTSDNEFLQLGADTQWSDGGKCYSHGPEWGIAHQLIKRRYAQEGQGPLPRIYFIKFAMGSTNLHIDWNPEGLYYDSFISFTRTMLSRVSELEHGDPDTQIQIDAMFWNQGDSDASGKADMRDNYESNLVKFVSRVWQDLAPARSGALPFIPLQLHWKIDENSKSTKKYRKSMDKVNEGISIACNKLGASAKMAQISPELEAHIETMCYDDGHSGSAALFIEGKLMLDTFLEMNTL